MAEEDKPAGLGASIVALVKSWQVMVAIFTVVMGWWLNYLNEERTRSELNRQAIKTAEERADKEFVADPYYTLVFFEAAYPKHAYCAALLALAARAGRLTTTLPAMGDGARADEEGPTIGSDPRQVNRVRDAIDNEIDLLASEIGLTANALKCRGKALGARLAKADESSVETSGTGGEERQKEFPESDEVCEKSTPMSPEPARRRACDGDLGDIGVGRQWLGLGLEEECLSVLGGYQPEPARRRACDGDLGDIGVGRQWFGLGLEGECLSVLEGYQKAACNQEWRLRLETRVEMLAQADDRDATPATAADAAPERAGQAVPPVPEQSLPSAKGERQDSSSSATASTRGASTPSCEQGEQKGSPSSVCVDLAERPIVYMQVVRSADREAAKALRNKLEERGWSIPGIEVVSGRRTDGDIRYYYDDQKDCATRLATDVCTAVSELTDAEEQWSFGRPKTISLAKTYRNLPRGRVELWLPARTSTSSGE